MIKSFIPPFKDPITANSKLNLTWEKFFQGLMELVSHIGFEQSFTLKNNVSVVDPPPAGAVDGPLNIDNLTFDFNKVQQVYVDYKIQRITSTTELIEAGTLLIVYKPKAGTWHIAKAFTGFPDNGGVTFSITPAGQVQYATTNMTGTVYVQKFTYRTRTLSSKLPKPASGWT